MRYHVLDSRTAYTAHMAVYKQGMIKAFTLTNLMKLPQLGIVVRKNILTIVINDLIRQKRIDLEALQP